MGVDDVGEHRAGRTSAWPTMFFMSRNAYTRAVPTARSKGSNIPWVPWQGLALVHFSAQRMHLYLRYIRISDGGQIQSRHSSISDIYDKQPQAIHFRAFAPKIQLNILESKDAVSRQIIDMVTFDSRFLS